MRVRLLNVQKLSDRKGDYILFLKCRRCQHYRYSPPQTFVSLLGEHAALATVAARLRCSACGAKDVEVIATSKSAGR